MCSCCYSAGRCRGTRKTTLIGNPSFEQVCTSFVKPHNLTMQMQMRRLARLINGVSKKCGCHVHMVALHTVCNNFVRIHKTLRITLAMVSRLTNWP